MTLRRRHRRLGRPAPYGPPPTERGALTGEPGIPSPYRLAPAPPREDRTGADGGRACRDGSTRRSPCLAGRLETAGTLCRSVAATRGHSSDHSRCDAAGRLLRHTSGTDARRGLLVSRAWLQRKSGAALCSRTSSAAQADDPSDAGRPRARTAEASARADCWGRRMGK
jgi:hypothetical protein